jgi:hypothetical protein
MCRRITLVQSLKPVDATFAEGSGKLKSAAWRETIAKDKRPDARTAITE